MGQARRPANEISVTRIFSTQGRAGVSSDEAVPYTSKAQGYLGGKEASVDDGRSQKTLKKRLMTVQRGDQTRRARIFGSSGGAVDTAKTPASTADKKPAAAGVSTATTAIKTVQPETLDISEIPKSMSAPPAGYAALGRQRKETVLSALRTKFKIGNRRRTTSAASGKASFDPELDYWSEKGGGTISSIDDIAVQSSTLNSVRLAELDFKRVSAVDLPLSPSTSQSTIASVTSVEALETAFDKEGALEKEGAPALDKVSESKTAVDSRKITVDDAQVKVEALLSPRVNVELPARSTSSSLGDFARLHTSRSAVDLRRTPLKGILKPPRKSFKRRPKNTEKSTKRVSFGETLNVVVNYYHEAEYNPEDFPWLEAQSRHHINLPGIKAAHPSLFGFMKKKNRALNSGGGGNEEASDSDGGAPLLKREEPIKPGGAFDKALMDLEVGGSQDRGDAPIKSASTTSIFKNSGKRLAVPRTSSSATPGTLTNSIKKGNRKTLNNSPLLFVGNQRITV